MFFRFGGDEFTVIFKRTKKEDLRKILNLLIQNVNDKINFDNIDFGLSISISHIDESTSLDENINRADKMMYEIKKKGDGILFWDEFKKKNE